jgi:hypothetical protein
MQAVIDTDDSSGQQRAVRVSLSEEYKPEVRNSQQA